MCRWVLGAVMASCAGGIQAQDKPLLVGFAQDTLANDWRAAQASGLERALAAHPHIRLVVTDGGGSTAKQIQDIEDLLAQKVDILVTSPRDERVMTPVIARAYRAGTPVVLLTRRIEGNDFTTFIAPDDRAIARAAAEHLAQELKGAGRILILQGVATASTTTRRTEAFEQALRRHPRLSIAAIKPANFLRNDAARAVEEVLREAIPFDAIYAQSDSMAVGARVALRGAGLRHVPIVGIDYIVEARAALRRGEQSASFTYPLCIPEAVAAILDIAAGRAVPRQTMVPSIKVTRENVERVEPIF